MQADQVGEIAPSVLVTLPPGGKVLASHELMLYKEPSVKMQRRTLRSLGVGVGKLISMGARSGQEEAYFLAEFEGPGHVSFSRDRGGEIRIQTLAPGETVRLKEGHLLCFDPTVHYDLEVLGRFYDPYARTGNNQGGWIYLVADRLTGPGTVVYQSNGNVLSFPLKPGEALRTSMSSLLLTEPTVTLQGQLLGQGTTPIGQLALPVLNVYGPGKVLIHSGL